MDDRLRDWFNERRLATLRVGFLVGVLSGDHDREARADAVRELAQIASVLLCDVIEPPPGVAVRPTADRIVKILELATIARAIQAFGALLGGGGPAPDRGSDLMVQLHAIARDVARLYPDPATTPEASERRAGVCRGCGCTDADCSGCIARTGAPCSWVEPDLCSACAAVPAAAAVL